MEWFLRFPSSSNQNVLLFLCPPGGAAFCKAKVATAFLSLGQDGEWEMGLAGLDDQSDVGFEHLRVGFALWTLVVSVAGMQSDTLEWQI